MSKFQYKPTTLESLGSPNVWDAIVFLIIFGIIAALTWAGVQMASPYEIGQSIEISLDPKKLPLYALSTTLRMLIAMVFSLLFTFTLAPLAAKNKKAENIVIPLIDIMQSVPVLGILAITVIGFIKIFPSSRLGPECAAIFAIFSSQVWNMILSLYQTLKTVPHDLREAGTMYRLSSWQKFWRIEVPFGAPALLWNTMVSMSASWFFVVYSEAIQVANQTIFLPGIGSYIAKAILGSDLKALTYAILTMLCVILLYDQLVFRPLLSWAEKFRDEIDEDMAIYESWFYDLLAKTKVLQIVDAIFHLFTLWFINLFPTKTIKKKISAKKTHTWFKKIIQITVDMIILILVIYCCSKIYTVLHGISFAEIKHVFFLGSVTAFKVIILITITSVFLVPIGVIIGLNPKATAIAQPLIQFAAAFPANLFYPLFVFIIIKYNLNKHIWTMPLMILGTQWYILFNVIGGAASIPKEIKLAAHNFNLKGWLLWKRLLLPAVFPHYATGAMTAAGGCWNASIVAEFVEWGNTTINSLGIGNYITEYTRTGDFKRIALGIIIMCFYVMILNRLLWQRLYNLAENRFAI